jgi:hypothetical protein
LNKDFWAPETLDRRFEKVVLPLWGIQLQLLGRPAASSVVVPTRLSQLPSKIYIEINTTEANTRPKVTNHLSEENQNSVKKFYIYLTVHLI